MQRIDTHHHFIPPVYRKALLSNGIDQAGGRALPDWTPEASVAAMADLGIATAILSVSAPGTAFLPDADDAADLARAVNDYGAGLVASAPDRFGLFATVPLPHVRHAAAEAARALDGLRADGVILLANNAGVYLGEDDEQDELWRVLDERSAVVFVHPATLPGPASPGRRTLRRGLPARHHPRHISSGAQRDSKPIPEHQVHPQSRRGLRSVCRASHGDGDHGRRQPQPR